MPWPNFGLTLKTKSQNHNVTFYRLPMGDLLFKCIDDLKRPLHRGIRRKLD